ncbi:MAG TPA: chemotaxis protein CheB [Polyangiaceae bacterium]|nr:chemotaxis protein CheB [Polyangiaceae bacterium]
MMAMLGDPLEAIVIGGSAGSMTALTAILTALPAKFAVPIAAVLHIPPMSRSLLAQVLSSQCALTAREAEDKEPLAASTVYVAPPNYHLLIERTHTFSLSADEPVNFSRPAIDVLFESAATAFGSRLAALVLTGANSDGALGLLRVFEAGGTALVQDPDTAAVRTMPEAALRAVPSAHVLRVEEIAPLLIRLAAGFGPEEA